MNDIPNAYCIIKTIRNVRKTPRREKLGMGKMHNSHFFSSKKVFFIVTKYIFKLSFWLLAKNSHNLCPFINFRKSKNGCVAPYQTHCWSWHTARGNLANENEPLFLLFWRFTRSTPRIDWMGRIFFAIWVDECGIIQLGIKRRNALTHFKRMKNWRIQDSKKY